MSEDNPYANYSAIPGEPDACEVEINAGPVTFIFTVSRLFMQKRKLEAHVSVDWRTEDGSDRRSVKLPMGTLPPTNVDWRSNSSLETLTKRMEHYYDPDAGRGKKTFPWMQMVQGVAQQVHTFVTTAGDLECADHVEVMAPDFLVKPIWPNRGTTIWFGQGETLKGQMAVAAGVGLSYGRNVAGMATKDLRRGLVYVDYEDDFGEFSTRVSRYVNGLGVAIPPNFRRYAPRGRLFEDVADQLKARIEADGGADAMIIDSALPAVNGDAVDPEPVGRFFAALAWIGIPTLVIAHETKAGNEDFPFGSQTWRTLARMNVNIQAGEEARTQDGYYKRDLLLRCTKANNVRRFSPMAFSVSFTDDENWQHQPACTWVKAIDPASVSLDLHSKLPLKDRLREYLRSDGHALTVKEIGEGTDIDWKVIDQTMRRHPDIFRMEGGGRGRGNAGAWSLMPQPLITTNSNKPLDLGF